MVRALLTDGDSRSVNSGSYLVPSTQNVDIHNRLVVHPVGNGNTSITARFHVQSVSAELSVTNDVIKIVSAGLSLPRIFNAEVGTRRMASLPLEFQDGTRFPDVRSVSHIDVSRLFLFSTSTPTVIKADADGGFTIMGNDYREVVAVAKGRCPGSSSVAASTEVVPNLDPKPDDVWAVAELLPAEKPKDRRRPQRDILHHKTEGQE